MSIHKTDIEKKEEKIDIDHEHACVPSENWN